MSNKKQFFSQDEEGWDDEKEEIKSQLVDLFLNVKVRSKDEISVYSEDKLTEEKELLNDASIRSLINYIKTSIEILMNLKVEDYIIIKKQEKNANRNKPLSSSSSVASSEPPQDYEEVIQKFEADIRKHIRIEQQMKLHSESLQQKIEDKEKEIDQIKTDMQKLRDDFTREKKLLHQIIDKKDKELQNQKELLDMKSKELLEFEQSTVEPNTAKSYIYRRNSSNKVKSIDQKINNYARVSERSQIKSNPYITEMPQYTTSLSKIKRKGPKSKHAMSQIERSSEIIKNFFNTTAGPTGNYKAKNHDISSSKHKR